MEIDGPAVAERTGDVAAAVARRVTAVHKDVYETILREIPQLRDDRPVLALLISSVDSNVATCLQVLQHRIDLATDDEHHTRLRETLLVFLESGGSYKTTAEQLTLHKNTVQYRVRKAQESLGLPVSDHRGDVELALRASRWLGSSVLGPATASAGETPRVRSG